LNILNQKFIYLDILNLKQSSSTARIDTLLDKQRRIDIQLHNENAANNRDILKILITPVCFLVKLSRN